MQALAGEGFYLGIDGGGTKTEAVVGTKNGAVVGRGMGGSANHHNIPLDMVYCNIATAVEKACLQAKNSGHDVDTHSFESICIGLSGVDSPQDRQRVTDFFNSLPENNRTFNGKTSSIVADGLIGLRSGTDENYGVCLIASTGSNCFGIDKSGREATAGDWGYILGDLGSGYAVGQKMLRQVMKEFDGRAQASAITPAVLSFLKMQSPLQLVNWTYVKSPPVAEISSLAQLLNADNFSLFAGKVMMELLQSYLAVVHRLDLESSSFPVVLVGGLFVSVPLFRETAAQLINKYTPAARVIPRSETPGVGALKVAIHGH